MWRSLKVKQYLVVPALAASFQTHFASVLSLASGGHTAHTAPGLGFLPEYLRDLEGMDDTLTMIEGREAFTCPCTRWPSPERHGAHAVSRRRLGVKSVRFDSDCTIIENKGSFSIWLFSLCGR